MLGARWGLLHEREIITINLALVTDSESEEVPVDVVRERVVSAASQNRTKLAPSFQQENCIISKFPTRVDPNELSLNLLLNC